MAIDFDSPQSPNTFAAGPTGGSSAVPTMRAIVWDDFDAVLRAALLASINCEQAGQTHQWLEFALSSNGASGVPITATGLKFTDRPPAFEFVDEATPIRASCLVPSSNGDIEIDIKFNSTGGAGGSSIFSTKITIPEGEYTSLEGDDPVITTTTHADDTEMSIILDEMGEDVVGLLVRMHVRWT